MTANGPPPFDNLAGMVSVYGVAPVYVDDWAKPIEPTPMPWPGAVLASWPMATRPRFVSKFSTRKRGAK